MGLTQTERQLAAAFLLLGLLPLWQTGLTRGINFYEWVWRHTVFAPRPMYIPREIKDDGTPLWS